MRLQEMSIDWVIAEPLPQIPIYRNAFNARGARVRPDAPPAWWVDPRPVGIDLTNVEQTNMINGSAHLWVYGYFSYLNFMNEEGCIGFVAKWEGPGLVRYSHPNYEYDR